ncbi:hypothetical protein [Paractinoplanes brasiliensis]|uniref:Uncharacterized protein n=1 Tax=Paractinoplanes brasiliensis TaxID=52695 RepID=A0A4R6JC30_9ACTN|nr:hypothetical protein [Actinoplanes brasiliensis]TDO32076.1 hypothetical protein C8E87_7518 [Actinoplanes brasiliensis]GID28124.1 hypothetical protein Abr02nite_31070 [Actinoplanes brasiliensis]
MDQHWDEVLALGETVVRETYPAELDDFDTAADWFRTTGPPGRVLRPPVGMGVEFASIVPTVLSAVSLLVTAVFTAAGEELSRATKERLAAVFRRDRRPGAAALTPEQEREIYLLIRSRAAESLPGAEAQHLAEAVIGALRLRGSAPLDGPAAAGERGLSSGPVPNLGPDEAGSSGGAGAADERRPSGGPDAS